ncbi:MAG: PspC domain-containing protein [Acidobacteria bacterium]|nr:PspC domain-containing protein [Acidobacteriota bacterium]MCL5287273.1 PspC domain-containing protein [Acidobacteriota bacterium]
MICANCQREIVPGSNFCYYCGARQAPPPPRPVMGQRYLMRSATNKRIAGVCAGFADYLGLDPALVRILWVLLTFFTAIFPGIILYIISWLIMPMAPYPLPAAPQPAGDQPR